MKFSALPVNVGDSFLLTTNDKTILVDGGMDKKSILLLLEKQDIINNHIDLLVCTHYDADHINGIIGILESGKYSFKEIWLPEILGSIGYTLSKSVKNFFTNIRENSEHFNDHLESESVIFEEYPDKEIKDNSINNRFEEIDCQILEYFTKENFYYKKKYFYSTNQYDAVLLTVNYVANVVLSSLRSGAYIRWFKYKKDANIQTCGFDMFPQNAIQTDITQFDNRVFMKALYAIRLSKINKYSLVYLHRKYDIPDILFTADSNLEFYTSPIQLKNGSIITSPHHGSSHNDQAYSKIQGTDLIYVRSDRSQQNRPGKGYTSQTYRYCTICRNKTPKQKVELIYNQFAFTTNAKFCIC